MSAPPPSVRAISRFQPGPSDPANFSRAAISSSFRRRPSINPSFTSALEISDEILGFHIDSARQVDEDVCWHRAESNPGVAKYCNEIARQSESVS